MSELLCKERKGGGEPGVQHAGLPAVAPGIQQADAPTRRDPGNQTQHINTLQS
jgi:hypothetical protein